MALLQGRERAHDCQEWISDIFDEEQSGEGLSPDRRQLHGGNSSHMEKWQLFRGSHQLCHQDGGVPSRDVTYQTLPGRES